MHDMTARTGGHRRRPAIRTRQADSCAAFPTTAYLRQQRAAQCAALCLRIWRHRRRQRRRHRAQLGRARRHRARAALRRDADAAADRGRAVRPPLCGADRHRADGRAVDRVAGRRSVDGEGGASARACPIRSASPAAPPSRKSRKSRRTCSGSSSIACAHDDHAIGFDLVRRAQAAGAQVLVLTLDVPVRTTRSRESTPGLVRRFQPDARMVWDMLMSPALAAGAVAQRPSAVRQHQRLCRRATPAPTTSSGSRGSEMGGAFSWDEVARYRERWKGPLVLKGILHPARRREGGLARHRRHLGVEPWRPPDRGAAAVDRLPAGDCRGGRQEARPSCSTAASAAAWT